ncbi:MAG TPA: hypothetical protein VK923_11655 [Euzebyales bacterium]|nr:hypothetical protein [Euzebyales bacterium]
MGTERGSGADVDRPPGDGSQVTSSAGRPAAPLVVQLITELRDAGVLYCHWKSNLFVQRAQQADTDLDLLVARQHSRAFIEVLSRCGFVAAHRPHATPIPGVIHYFGYDEAVDRFVHVHAHHHLVVGHDRTKNYRLPIEGAFLASVSASGGLPTPSAEFEYVVFIIRMVLKYAVFDELLWDGARGRRARPRMSERQEHDHLRALITPEGVHAIVDEHLPFVGRELFAEAERVAMGTAPVLRTAALGRRMEATLAAHARRVPSVDALVRMWRRTSLAVRRRTGARPGYRLADGGAIIAIMGGDGAGKTTALREIGVWLDEHFDVARVHLGKPPWSLTTYAVRGGLKLAGPAVPGVGGLTAVSRPSAVVGGGTASQPGYRQLIWFACKARDRYRTYRRASRAANLGSIVISDRFPHPSLPLTDMPQIARLTADASTGRFLEALDRLEQHYHDLVALPDLAIVLKLDPLEAARRKTDEPQDYVIERSTEVWDIDWTGSGVHVIDAGKPLEAVAGELKALIWESLA